MTSGQIDGILPGCAEHMFARVFGLAKQGATLENRLPLSVPFRGADPRD
jgi:hypothetical protein